MTDASPGSGLPRFGPGTIRRCVTAACTRCGAAPLDEDSGLTPHFDSAGQAREELPRDWGWHLSARSAGADDEELLCPACATAAGNAGNPPPPDPGQEAAQEPGPLPWWENPAQPRPALPPNAAIRPAAPRTREEG